MGKRNRSISESSNSSSDDLSSGRTFMMDQNRNDCITGPRRRGRGLSKRPCLNKNALMARQNRQKKKEYMENMETQLHQYRRENKNQANMIQQQTIDLKRLAAENSYLRSVLKNKTTITNLLSSMNQVLGQKVSSKSHSVEKPQEKKMAAINATETFSSSGPSEILSTTASCDQKQRGWHGG